MQETGDSFKIREREPVCYAPRRKAWEAGDASVRGPRLNVGMSMAAKQVASRKGSSVPGSGTVDAEPTPAIVPKLSPPARVVVVADARRIVVREGKAVTDIIPPDDVVGRIDNSV